MDPPFKSFAVGLLVLDGAQAARDCVTRKRARVIVSVWGLESTNGLRRSVAMR